MMGRVEDDDGLRRQTPEAHERERQREKEEEAQQGQAKEDTSGGSG